MRCDQALGRKPACNQLLGRTSTLSSCATFLKIRKPVAPTRARSLLLQLADRSWLFLSALAKAGDFLQPRDAEGIALRAAVGSLKASLQRKQHNIAGVSRVDQAVIH